MPSVRKPKVHDEVPTAELHVKPSAKPLPKQVDACQSDCMTKNKENDAGADLVRITCRKLCIELCVDRCHEEQKTEHGTCKRICSGAS
jgi:hypothetical protein